MQHGGSVLNPNSQPKTTRNTLPVHLLQNNSGKFVVFAFGRCSRHFIVFSRRKTSCARRGNLPPPISSLQNQLKLKQLPDLHTCILQDSFPGKLNSSWVIRNNFTLHLSQFWSPNFEGFGARISPNFIHQQIYRSEGQHKSLQETVKSSQKRPTNKIRQLNCIVIACVLFYDIFTIDFTPPKTLK